MKHYWVLCQKCGHHYIEQFFLELGQLFAANRNGENCIECNSPAVDITDEYRGGE